MRWDKGNAAIYAVLLAALAVACATSILCGPAHVSWARLAESGILRLRLFRTALSAVVGAGLSVAGVILQAVLRNPLAEPYVLGVSSGGAIGAAAAIVLGFAAAAAWTVPAMGFLGAMLALGAVSLVARGPDGRVLPQTLLLSGVIVGAVLGSVLMFLVSTASSEELHGVVWWLLGSLQAFDGRLLLATSVAIGLGVAAAVRMAPELDPMTLGDEKAACLGMDVQRTRRQFFLLASLITGAAVAASGMIGFVGLMVPHSVRMVIGPGHRRLAPACALAGAAFLVLADCAARSVLAPRELPVGVITSLAGGPFFSDPSAAKQVRFQGMICSFSRKSARHTARSLSCSKSASASKRASSSDWSGPTARERPPCFASRPASWRRGKASFASRGETAARFRGASRAKSGLSAAGSTGRFRFYRGRNDAHGRWPHRRGAGGPSETHLLVVHRSMEAARVAHLADRPITELSGGERQRVGVAMCLAQQPDILLLDEPISHLDVGQQVSLAQLLEDLRRKERLTMVGVFHDLNMAAVICDRLVLLDQGRVAAPGPPGEVLTPASIAAVFEVAGRFEQVPTRIGPRFFFVPR